MLQKEQTFCSRMHLVCLHLTKLLRNWLEQRLSNEGELDSSVTKYLGKIYYTGVGLIVPDYRLDD
jgi:hypothetical protein